MYRVIFHKFRCNSWNEWTDTTDLGIVETKEQGFEYAKKHYPELIAVETKEHDYHHYDEKGNETTIPYNDYIEIKDAKNLGGEL